MTTITRLLRLRCAPGLLAAAALLGLTGWSGAQTPAPPAAPVVVPAVVPAVAPVIAPVIAPAVQAAAPAPAASAVAAKSGFHIRPVDDAWRAALPRDAHAATQAYLDRLPADVVARSNAYYEGGYWLQLANALAALAVAALLLFTRPSTALRNWAGRRFKWPPLRDAVYAMGYFAASGLLMLPLSFYQGYWREHRYGMSTQTVAGWLGDEATGLLVSLVAGALVVAALYAVLRRAGARWWLWASGVMMGFMVLMLLVAPIWIEPLFNTYKPVPDGPVKRAVLAMAHANGVPVDNVYVFDASRQTTRISANVSGIFGTAAVRLNDNLLDRTSPAEVRAVMAHEIGHFTLNHIPKMLLQFAVVVLAGFFLTQWVVQRLLARFGHRWGVAAVHDVASLPLLAAVFSTCMVLATPAINSFTRMHETEADLFGLNLAREPHAEAEVLLKLVEYRKPDPSALEEIIFFTHPSTRTRIYHAMRWREQMLLSGALPP